MTEVQARRILDEHRTECPCFVRGHQAYQVRLDGRVDIFRVTPSDRRIFELTVAATSYALHPDVRARAQETT